MTVANKSPVKMAGDDPSAVEAQRISGEIAIDREAVRRASLATPGATPPAAAPVDDASDDGAVASAEAPASDPATPPSAEKT